MVFNSLTFVVFFAIVLGLHSLPFPWTVKKTNLLLASYIFYAAWSPPFVVLLWITTLVDFFVAKLIFGLFEKVAMADGIVAPVADKLFTAANQLGFQQAWVATLAFSAQIFLDFDGYSICAIGAAMCLGFMFPDNFRFPYAAIGFSDFWRRWHISLSTWLRDYLYVSLGGNRKGRVRTYGNLMLTMLIGGLWHGAAWRFVFWGGLHGTYLTVERMLKGVFPDSAFFKNRVYLVVMALVTFVLISFTWVFFRANDFHGAFHMSMAMIGVGSAGPPF